MSMICVAVILFRYTNYEHEMTVDNSAGTLPLGLLLFYARFALLEHHMRLCQRIAEESEYLEHRLD